MSSTATFSIRDLPIYGDVILSPMDGYSDLPFRSICRELGSAMSYTEFVNALDILQGHPYVHEKLAFMPHERPVVFQIFDSDPDRLLEVALRLQEYGPDAIDVNLGCSVRNVASRGAGAGLLRTPETIAEIFKKMTHALKVPVTGKMRLGWDDASRNYQQVAHILEDNGASAIAVHGRTKKQGYLGEADWEAIAEVVQAVSIPVIGNGDVRTVADIDRMKAYTGCKAVMVGRGAMGNPWIFSRLNRDQVALDQVRVMISTHLARMVDFYGPEHGLVWFRKHVKRYLSPYPLPEELHLQLMTATSSAEFQRLVDTVFQDQKN